jgi:hypothetical protein
MTVGGSHWKTTVPKSITSAIPTTNSGRAARASMTSDDVESNTLSRRIAAQIPIPTASGIETSAAQKTRKAELTTGSWISVETGRLAASDLPRFPCRTPPAQLRYWSSTGRLRCRLARSAARLSGVAFRPRIAFAGSLGSACVAPKMITETSHKVRIPSASRRIRKPLMPRNSLM